MNIIHVNWGRCNPNSANGVDQTISHLSSAQSKQGHQVWIASVTSKKTISIEGVSLLSFSPKTIRLPLGKSFSYASSEMARSIIALNPDIVHFHSIHIPGFIGLAALLRKAKIPYCVTPHGALTPAALHRNFRLKLLLMTFGERNYLEKAKFLHLVSSNEIPGVEDLGLTTNCVVLPNGVASNLLLFQPDTKWLRNQVGIGSDKVIGVFLGRLDPHHKGLDLLLKAVRASALTNLTIVLIGPDFRGGREQLEAQAHKLGLSEQVVFLGPQYGTDKLNGVAGGDFFLHPSRYEGAPFSVLEALALGIPCLLSTSADPDGNLATIGASITVAAGVPELAQGLRKIVTLSHQQRLKMGRAARQTAEVDYSWSTIASSLTKAYSSNEAR